MPIFSSQLPSIKALQCFVAVARELNFRRASELLHMSQPPLSRQIQGLEQLLKVKLINRNTHSVSLTPAGEAFEKEAHAILVALDAAVHSVGRFSDDEHPSAKQVRLGLTSAIDFTLMPKLRTVLGLGHQHQERAYSRLLVERVRSGKLDLAIVGDIANPGDGLTVHRVGYDPMVVVLPQTHPAAQKNQVSLRDLGETPLFWFSRSDNPSLYDKCERVFTAFGYSAPRRLEPQDFTTLLALVAAGEGVGFCPASMQAASRIGAVYRPFEPELERRLTIDVQLISRTHESRKEVLDSVESILEAAAA
jgi:LysR family transcriptional regulator, benzoate and cis,cis-muconate-responsive activator of ben and cat genes